MKLCLLGYNGSVHIQKWVHALSQQREIELHVITFNKGIKYENVTYHHLKGYTGNKIDYILNILLLKRLIKTIEPDIVHAHYATSYGFMGACLNFHPYIITGWGSDIFDSPKNGVMKCILKYSLKKADAISVLSKVTLKEISKLTDKKVEIIPFGVNLNKFYKRKSTQDGIIRIGTIRTLSEKYGVEYLIRAFELLYKKYKNIQLEIVGDGVEREFLKRLTDELRVSDRIVFHGFVSQTSDFERYISILNNFDIFAILSTKDSETFGVAAIEALACAIPVVATNVGGLTEIIENNNTGLIVKVKDATETAVAIEKMILDEGLRKTLGENGRKKVERLYNWKSNVDQMMKVYEKCLQSKGP
jgi:glycosyltransferase involved in cell wall biosynthesis